MRYRGVWGLLLALLLLATIPTYAEQFTFKLQSAFPDNELIHQMFPSWAEKVEVMSGGRIKIHVVPVGSVVPPLRLFDAVNEGVLDIAGTVSVYNHAKDAAFSLLGSGPAFGLDANEVLGWYYYGGGQQLYSQLLAKHKLSNIVPLVFGPMRTQGLGWFKKPIVKPEDLKGLRFRTPALAAEMTTELGATVMVIPAGEIVPNAEKGLLDATEYNNPTSDRTLGLPRVFKVHMAQSYHQPAEGTLILINKKKFDSLPKDLQQILRNAALAESQEMQWKWMDLNSKDFQKLIHEEGVKIIKTPKEILLAQLKAFDRVVARHKDNELFMKMLTSMKDWAKRVTTLDEWVTVDRAPAYEYYQFGK